MESNKPTEKDILKALDSLLSEGKKLLESLSREPNKDWEVVTYGYIHNNENKPDREYIHTVKRLSDNSVFSVGDEIINHYVPHWNKPVKIKEFFTEKELHSEKIIMCVKGDFPYEPNPEFRVYRYRLKDISKTKAKKEKPLPLTDAEIEELRRIIRTNTKF